MRKMVCGHTSKQAPATRLVYTTRIKYTRAGDNCYISDLSRALKWYANGNIVCVIVERDGFIMHRNTSAMTPSIVSRVYCTWDKKGGQAPTKRQLDYISNNNGGQGVLCTF